LKKLVRNIANQLTVLQRLNQRYNLGQQQRGYFSRDQGAKESAEEKNGWTNATDNC